MSEMKITSLAPWFGGKRTLAPRIVEALGPHTYYAEPFCGSMAVLFAKPKSRAETVNDLHGDLINLARCVQSDDHAPELFDRLQRVLVHEDALAEARAMTVEAQEPPDEAAPDVARAAAFFITSWVGRNGECGLAKNERSTRICVRWNANGGDPATRFRSAIASMPAWWARLQGVTILRRNGFEIIDRIDDQPGTVVYCDPPYVEKSDEYLHDFRDDGMFGDDHLRLATSLRRFATARVVVSYYDCPRVRELYDGWTFVDCTMTKGLHNAGKRGQKGKTAPEVLIINGPSFTA